MPMLGLEYGGRRRLVDREGMADFRCMSHRGANSIHAVPADYAQGMHAGMRGGSPVRADGERREARIGKGGMAGHFFSGWHIHGGRWFANVGWASSSLVAGKRSTCCEDVLRRFMGIESV